MKVLYAGSFDPFHDGHLGIVVSAASSFDEVVVAVTANPGKPKRTPLDRRAENLRPRVDRLANVEVVWHEGLTTDLARSLGVDALIRGVTRDHGNEFSMAHMNLATSGIPTIFIPAAASTRHLSSTALRTAAPAPGNQ